MEAPKPAEASSEEMKTEILQNLQKGFKKIVENHLDGRVYNEDKIKKWVNNILSECKEYFSIKYPSYDLFLFCIVNEKGVYYRQNVLYASIITSDGGDFVDLETEFLYVGAQDNTQAALKLEEVQEYIDNGIVNYCGETNDVPSYVKKCSVFVLPSYYREGVPRTLLEALAMGRPIITTETIGCKETVKDGENGFFVPIKDSKALAEKMIYTIEHRDELHKMSDKSYEYCKERFDVDIINKRMLEIMKI